MEAVAGGTRGDGSFSKIRRQELDVFLDFRRNLEQTIGQYNFHVNPRGNRMSKGRTAAYEAATTVRLFTKSGGRVFHSVVSCATAIAVVSNRKTFHCALRISRSFPVIRTERNVEFESMLGCSVLLSGRPSYASKSDCGPSRRVASRFLVGYHLRQPQSESKGLVRAHGEPRPYCAK